MSPPQAPSSEFVDVDLSPPGGRDRDLEQQREEAPAARRGWWGRLGGSGSGSVYSTRVRGGATDAKSPDGRWMKRAERRMCYAFVIVVAAVAVGWLIYSVVQRERVVGRRYDVGSLSS